MQENYKMQVWSLGQEDSLEEDMATHSSILAWRIPWTEEPGGLQSIEWPRVRHGWSNLTHTNDQLKTALLSRKKIPSQKQGLAMMHMLHLMGPNMVVITTSDLLPPKRQKIPSRAGEPEDADHRWLCGDTVHSCGDEQGGHSLCEYWGPLHSHALGVDTRAPLGSLGGLWEHHVARYHVLQRTIKCTKAKAGDRPKPSLA